MSVRAAVMPAFEKPLEIREYPDPGDLAPGETLVRVEMAGICGTRFESKSVWNIEWFIGTSMIGYVLSGSILRSSRTQCCHA